MSMQETDHHEPEHAAVMKLGRRTSPLFHTARHENDSCTEEDGKESHELFHRKDIAERPNPKIGAGEIAEIRWVGVGRHGHGEALNIHHQNPQNSYPSQDV